MKDIEIKDLGDFLDLGAFEVGDSCQGEAFVLREIIQL